MSNVTDIADARPHYLIDGIGGEQLIIPAAFFEEVRTGAISLKNLDDFESVVPTIINEWLLSRGAER